MPARPSPLRDELAQALPERPFSIEFWDGSRLAATNGGGPTFHLRSPAAVGARPARPRPARPRPRVRVGRARRGRPRRRARAARQVEAAGLDRPRARGSRSPPCGRAASRGRRRVPAAELRPRGAPPQRRARRARRAPPLRRLQRLLRAVPRRVDDLQLRGLLARSEDARGGAGDQARAGLHEARAAAGRARARRRLRLGQLRRSTPRADHGVQRHRASRSRRRRPSSRAGGSRRPGSPTRSRSAWRTTASSPASRSTRSPRSAWSSTSATARSTATPTGSRGCCAPAGGCSTTGSPACATATPRRARSPSATCSPTPRRCISRGSCSALERAGFATDHVEGLRDDYAETLRHWTERLDENLDEARRLAGDERARVWRLYLRAARNGFVTGFTSIYQVRCRRS